MAFFLLQKLLKKPLQSPSSLLRLLSTTPTPNPNPNPNFPFPLLRPAPTSGDPSVFSLLGIGLPSLPHLLEDDTRIWADSVKRKRKVKMNKHKYKKRRKLLRRKT